MQVKIKNYMAYNKTHAFSRLTLSWGWKGGKFWKSNEEICFSQYEGVEDAKDMGNCRYE